MPSINAIGQWKQEIKKSRASEGSAFFIVFYVFKLESKHQAWFVVKVRLMVDKATRTINEKLCLMPRMALTEETGIILARHLKSCKRRTPPQTPFLSDHGPMAVIRLFVWGSLRRLCALMVARTVQELIFLCFFLLFDEITDTWLGQKTWII